jgi:hypothetical protein
MGDTQKSQTISTESQGIASQVAYDLAGCSNGQEQDKLPVLVGESSLVQIRLLAEADPYFNLRPAKSVSSCHE